MIIIKRNGTKEPMRFDKITSRLKPLSSNLSVDIHLVTKNSLKLIVSEISSFSVDNLVSSVAASMYPLHPDYLTLASRLLVSNNHKSTPDSFSSYILSSPSPNSEKIEKSQINEDLIKFVEKNKKKIDAHITPERDFNIDYFSYTDLKSTLISNNDKERYCYLLMRISISLHLSITNDNTSTSSAELLKAIFSTYDSLSQDCISLSKPIISYYNNYYNTDNLDKNKYTPSFILEMAEDSMAGIYETNKLVAVNGRHSTGGMNISRVRARGSYIAGTNGNASGVIPLLAVVNSCLRFNTLSTSSSNCERGNKNKGMAVYLEVWHADVEEFIGIKRNSGSEEGKFRDLNISLLVNDLFMKRVEKDAEWSLFSPDTAVGLVDVSGEQFERVYIKYEGENKARKRVKARKLLTEICRAQVETGMPSVLYKDRINSKYSNGKIIAGIDFDGCAFSNLKADSGAVLKNEGSINVGGFIKEEYKDSNGLFLEMCMGANIKNDKEKVEKVGSYLQFIDLEKLHEESKAVVKLLNNFARKEQLGRSLSVSYHGISEVFNFLKIRYDSEEAREVSRAISETVYHGAIISSIEFNTSLTDSDSDIGAKEFKLEFSSDYTEKNKLFYKDWESIRKRIDKEGCYNDFIISLRNDNFGFYNGNEPLSSNVKYRTVDDKEVAVFNTYLVKDCLELGVWSNEIMNEIIKYSGSVKSLNIPEKLKMVYRTVWEIPQKSLFEINIDKQKFVDQSIACNVYFENSNLGKLVSMHMFGWKNGLKTGCNYVRIKNQSSVVRSEVKKVKVDEEVENDEGCLSCSA